MNFHFYLTKKVKLHLTLAFVIGYPIWDRVYQSFLNKSVHSVRTSVIGIDAIDIKNDQDLKASVAVITVVFLRLSIVIDPHNLLISKQETPA